MYSFEKAYMHLIGSNVVHLAFRWLWSATCQQKHKVFFWLLLQDRRNTRGLLKRKHMQLESYSCGLCLLHKEERLTFVLQMPFCEELLVVN
jgi:hypothetical protein